jgi:hypothetical protein
MIAFASMALTTAGSGPRESTVLAFPINGAVPLLRIVGRNHALQHRHNDFVLPMLWLYNGRH